MQFSLFCCRWFVDYSSKKKKISYSPRDQRMFARIKNEWSCADRFGYIHQSSSTQFRFMATIHHYMWFLAAFFFFFLDFMCVPCIAIAYIYILYLIIIRRWIVDKHHNWRTKWKKNMKIYSELLLFVCQQWNERRRKKNERNETFNNPVPLYVLNEMWWAMICIFVYLVCKTYTNNDKKFKKKTATEVIEAEIISPEIQCTERERDKKNDEKNQKQELELNNKEFTHFFCFVRSLTARRRRRRRKKYVNLFKLQFFGATNSYMRMRFQNKWSCNLFEIFGIKHLHIIFGEFVTKKYFFLPKCLWSHIEYKEKKFLFFFWQFFGHKMRCIYCFAYL